MSKKKNVKDVFKSYLGSKNEGQGFADKRKKKAAYEYLKLLKKEKQKLGKTESNDLPQHKSIAFLKSHLRGPTKKQKAHAFTAAEKVARKKKEERDKKHEESQRIQKEKSSALTAYKDKKKMQHLKLCKRTSKGQPVMKYQMEVLFDKIKNQKKSQ